MIEILRGDNTYDGKRVFENNVTYFEKEGYHISSTSIYIDGKDHCGNPIEHYVVIMVKN